ncbi:MAG: hypothetical protein AAGF12_00600 [Myxococcota bacterium]
MPSTSPADASASPNGAGPSDGRAPQPNATVEAGRDATVPDPIDEVLARY